MDKLFLAILNMSLTGAFVIAAICLVRLPLKKAPKLISYCLWAVAGFRLVFPFSLESVFSLVPFQAQTIPADIGITSRIESGIALIDSAVSASLPAATPAASVNPLQVWIWIASHVWLIGAAVMLIYGIVTVVLLKRSMRSAAHIEANIYESETIGSPFVLGVFKPKIYLPSVLSEHARGYIMLHEQTHIRRYDHIIKLAAYLILCLHWFNPLAWMAFYLLGVDMEMSCDERVLKELGSGTKKDYSLLLLALATERRILGSSPLAFSEGDVKKRILHVLRFKEPSRLLLTAAVVLVAVLSVCFTLNRPDQASTSAHKQVGVPFAQGTSEGTIDHESGILLEDDRVIYVTGRKAVHMTITGYHAWVAAGEKDADVYDFSERVIYTPIGKGPEDRVYMKISDYKAWAAAGENDADVYKFAVPFSEDGQAM